MDAVPLALGGRGRDEKRVRDSLASLEKEIEERENSGAIVSAQREKFHDVMMAEMSLSATNVE